MSNIISLFFEIRLLMHFVKLVIIFSRISVDSSPNSSSMSHCCVVVVDMPISWDYLHGLHTFIMVTRWSFFPPIVIYDHRPMDSLSSSEVVIRGMISVVAMVTVLPVLYMVSYDIDASDVISFILGQNWFSIFVVLYLLFGCFQFVFVSDRHATSTSLRNMLLLISSRVNASLDSSSPPTFWEMRWTQSDTSLNVRFFLMYGFTFCSDLR